MLSLAPGLDLDAAAAAFKAHGHVRLSPFLAPKSANLLANNLASRRDWKLVVNSGETVYEFDADALAAMSPEQHSELEARIAASAKTAFQFRFSSIRVPERREDRRPDTDLVHAFAELMCAKSTLDQLRAITGSNSIVFADAQATAYRSGDFLTEHDDNVSGKQREAAYVLGLTSDWKADWGGLLLFDSANASMAAHAPGFNTLDLFSVPQPHSVSLVTPFAGATRYAITGWLRAAQPSQDQAEPDRNIQK